MWPLLDMVRVSTAADLPPGLSIGGTSWATRTFDGRFELAPARDEFTVDRPVHEKPCLPELHCPGQLVPRQSVGV